MTTIVTLSQRKKQAALRNLAAVDDLRAGLRAYAQTYGGKFILFGSAARGEMRHDSDVDILVDFPEELTSDAWTFAEDECRRLDLRPDIKPIAFCREPFLAHVRRHWEVLG